jgi:paraquat-inducible protein B
VSEQSPAMPESSSPPVALVAPAKRPSWVWILPGIALLAVGALLYQTNAERGPRVTISFTDGGGLQAGNPVTCRGLQIGAVQDVRLSRDRSSVQVIVELRPDAESLAVEGSAWWIVRPEVNLRRVRGLETLFGPRYLEVQPGPPDGGKKRRFEGLQAPPEFAPPSEGALRVVLRAARRGSLEIGSPVAFRDMTVGHISSLTLADDSSAVNVGVFIERRYATLVRDKTRFWNASGIGLDMGLFSGLKLRTESLESVLSGGIAFATPERSGEPVADGHVFDLAENPSNDWLTWAPQIPLEDGG